MELKHKSHLKNLDNEKQQRAEHQKHQIQNQNKSIPKNTKQKRA